jgi:glycosyltransferase involved in cell wall biosynthesis
MDSILKKENITISVIIPFYKEFDLIGRCVESVFSQSSHYASLEVIISNDSNRKSSEITSLLSEYKNIKVVDNLESHGPGNARNAAINTSSGELIAFLDADDFWLPTKISQQLSLIQNGANFVVSSYILTSSQTVIIPPDKIINGEELLIKNNVGTSTVLLTRSLLGADRFKNLKFSQDKELWFRLSNKESFKYGACKSPLVAYSTSGRTSNKIKMALHFGRLLKNIDSLILIKKIYIFIRYALLGVNNHYVRKICAFINRFVT